MQKVAGYCYEVKRMYFGDLYLNNIQIFWRIKNRNIDVISDWKQNESYSKLMEQFPNNGTKHRKQVLDRLQWIMLNKYLYYN